MGRQYSSISEEHRAFIRRQSVYFVATAAPGGRVNVSPKGMDTLRVVAPDRVVWLNLTGSGNETAAHLLRDDRTTLMFCAFAGDPLILRLYGAAAARYPRDREWEVLLADFDAVPPGLRQIIELRVDLVQTSCGFGVPLMDYRGERGQLADWAAKKGPEGIRRYWQEHNRTSIDGFPAGMESD